MDVRRAIAVGAMALLSAQSAFAQHDIVGAWGPPAAPGGIFGFFEDNPERQDGPELVDFLGIPFNEAGRARALSYDPSLLTVPEHQCMPHPTIGNIRGFARLTECPFSDPPPRQQELPVNTSRHALSIAG